MRVSRKVWVLSLIFLVVGLFLFLLLKKTFFKPKEIEKAKVAIVIDDWGYSLVGLKFIREIDAPITISILPNLRYSSKTAQEAKRFKKEVILHLPLEPEMEGRKIRLETNTITTDMTEKKIIENFSLAINSVSYASGVSNHMGSKATKDSRVMSVIFGELKKRDLFFLDNLVTDDSVCAKLAYKTRVKFVLRDVFLDNITDDKYIKGQLQRLKEAAVENGQAVGIGHARIATLQVLKDEIPLLEKEGIKFVFVSDLAE